MIAYNRDWLDALMTKSAASKWHEKGLLTKEQWKNIEEQNTTGFYTPNVFVRIGLAIFSLILLLAAMGLVALITGLDSNIGITLFSFFWAFVCIAILELRIIGIKQHMGSGIDDMLLYVAVGAIITGFCMQLDYSTPMLVYYGIALPVLVFGSIRYLDRLMAVVAFLCLLFMVLLVVKDIPSLAVYLLPFAGMLFSAGVYFFVRQGQNRNEWRQWHRQLILLELLSLATFYASGNYWIVQQAGADFFQLESVPMAWFFWIFSFAVPAVYLFWGLRTKDRHLLDVGLACIAAAVFTVRYYFHVIPLAWASVICGAILFAIAYFSIRYLRQNEGAYTYEEDSDTSLLQEIEEQLLEQTIVNQPGATPNKNDSFGGGQFGGGGASGEF